MKKIDLKSKSEIELKEMLKALKKDMESISSEMIKGKEKNVKKLGFMKKDFARVLTALKMKEENK